MAPLPPLHPEAGDADSAEPQQSSVCFGLKPDQILALFAGDDGNHVDSPLSSSPRTSFDAFPVCPADDGSVEGDACDARQLLDAEYPVELSNIAYDAGGSNGTTLSASENDDEEEVDEGEEPPQSRNYFVHNGLRYDGDIFELRPPEERTVTSRPNRVLEHTPGLLSHRQAFNRVYSEATYTARPASLRQPLRFDRSSYRSSVHSSYRSSFQSSRHVSSEKSSPGPSSDARNSPRLPTLSPASVTGGAVVETSQPVTSAPPHKPLLLALLGGALSRSKERACTGKGFGKEGSGHDGASGGSASKPGPRMGTTVSSTAAGAGDESGFVSCFSVRRTVRAMDENADESYESAAVTAKLSENGMSKPGDARVAGSAPGHKRKKDPWWKSRSQRTAKPHLLQPSSRANVF